jgi:hypothetical protein
MVSQRPDLMEEGKARILMQMSTSPHPAIPDVPLIMDLAETDKDKAVLRMVFSPQAMGRPFVAPAGVPEDRVAALRAAFDATMKDPEYIADVEQQGLDLAPVSGEEIQALVLEMYDQPQEIIDAAKEASTNEANLPITEVKIEKVQRLAERAGAAVDPIQLQLEGTATEATATLQALRRSLDEMAGVLSTDSELGYGLQETLASLRAAADALSLLATSLEQNPDMLIRGKKLPENR